MDFFRRTTYIYDFFRWSDTQDIEISAPICTATSDGVPQRVVAPIISTLITTRLPALPRAHLVIPLAPARSSDASGLKGGGTAQSPTHEIPRFLRFRRFRLRRRPTSATRFPPRRARRPARPVGRFRRVPRGSSPATRAESVECAVRTQTHIHTASPPRRTDVTDVTT